MFVAAQTIQTVVTHILRPRCASQKNDFVIFFPSEVRISVNSLVWVWIPT